ncbi:MAG: hypothetical protein GWO16_07520 [Gammaproteobacteria bacterium]|nr:hypothetical protein [Gammaproteobacteria bacterium]NIR97808.1 hypothetical protein [Gammaproteobacteria bacterium]NIT63508.1 hypothetical protein [Gammaproteobacteria bacterium]NIV20455.1 hypothetical protein [Gammaproteobacteria bacterium]NIX11037.1 hypothetical protein [Gammaproteobacteria bacterium]
MGKPTPEQMEKALSEAARMREQGEDLHFVAKALLNLNYRYGYLERVLAAARRFLRSGMASSEHAALLHAIDKALEAETRTAGEDREDFGLSRSP